jgi:hypothetical protein
MFHNLQQKLMFYFIKEWAVLTMSSRGARGLGDRVVEDDDDTCRDRGGGVV